MNRRHFLASAATAAGAASLRAIEPIQRPGRPHFQLACAAYGFREYFTAMRDKEVKPKEGHEPMDMFRFIDLCADNGCDGAELTAYFFPPRVMDEYLLKVRHHAYLRGIAISGTAIGNNWTYAKGTPERAREIAYTKEWIDKAAVMGAPHIRVFAGSAPKGMSLEEGTRNCIEAYKECADYAGKKGVFLGLENHHGIVSDPDNLVHIIRSVDSPWVGINFDSGNFNTPDPYADLAKIAPYSINVQLKTEIKRQGAKEGEPSDVPRVLKILREAGYQGWFTLEYEAKEDPFAAVPRILRELKPLLG